MKEIIYKTEDETAKAVVEFTIKGVKFAVVGRKNIIVFEK